MKTIYLIDAFSILFRAYYAIGNMTNKEGFPTGALFGFIRTVEKFLNDFSPEYVCAVFDGPNNKEKRVAIYEDYKKNRTAMPEDLYAQLVKVHDYCAFSGIPLLQEPGLEADDIIGSIAKHMESEGFHVVVISGDKDLCQLVTDKTNLLHLHKDNKVIDKKAVIEMFGVEPCQIVDYLAIAGDTSDNIPGIPGFGPKTSTKLLQQFGSVERLLNNLDKLENARWKDKILENKEKLLISQKLASLHLDAPFPKSLSFFKKDAMDVDRLSDLFTAMNFSSLLKQLKSSAQTAEEKPDASNYELINSQEALLKMVTTLEQAQEIAFDTETTGIDVMKAEMVGLSFSCKESHAYYVPFNAELKGSVIIDAIKPLFQREEKTFIAHNLKYDMHMLKSIDIEIKGATFDTLIAAHLVEGTTTGLSLDALTLSYFHVVKTPISDLIGSGKNKLSMKDVPLDKITAYSGADADFTLRVKHHLEPRLKELEMEDVFYDIEMPLCSVLMEMERAGVLIDKELLSSMSVHFGQLLTSLEQAIFETVGTEFNLKSPKQLSAILFDKMGIKPPGGKKTTKADVLEKLKAEHPFIKDILRYRALEKLRSTYIDALPMQIHPDTRRIHCSFSQVGTSTGRLASQNPNLQNIPIRSPEGKKIRQAFIPGPGYTLISADYSQIELRLLAHFSGDPVLTESFNKGEDIHIATAAKVFDIDLSQVSSSQRSAAKAVNFGILYGQSAFGLAGALDISAREARSFIDSYFNTYPAIKAYLDSCKEQAKESGFTTTLFGRKRPLKDINSSNAIARSAAERLAVNSPIQGSQADIIKIAMIQIQKELKKRFSSFMTIQIHDELLFEVKNEEVEAIKVLVKERMEQVVTLNVPLPVNILVGKNWAEC